jgi:hypothetical protein
LKAPPLNVSVNHLQRNVWKVALLLLRLVPTRLVAAGSGPDEGTVTGQLVVGGKPTRADPLAYGERVAGRAGDDRLLVLKLRPVFMRFRLDAC